MIFTTWLGTGYGHIDEDGILVDGEIEYGSVREESAEGWTAPEAPLASEESES